MATTKAEYKREWCKQNPEKVKEYNRRFREKNREKCNEASKCWYQENKERCNEVRRRRQEKNPEQRKEWDKRYREKNSEYCRQYRKQNAEKINLLNVQRRARLRNTEVTLTEEQWQIIKNMFKQKCVYCGKRTRRLTKDHVIPLSQGGALTLSNIVPACKSCNSKKRDGLPLKPLQIILL